MCLLIHNTWLPEDCDWLVFCRKNAIEERGTVLWILHKYTVKYLMVSFYLQISVFWTPVCCRKKCGLGESERQHHPQGFKALPILCITVIKPEAVSEHTALGVCCSEGLVDMWKCPCKAECFWLGHLFVADTNSQLLWKLEIICPPRVGDE